MVKKIIHIIQSFFANRILLLLLIFTGMTAVLSVRMFSLQIINGQEYTDNFSVKTTRTRTLKSTRGNIYDAAGRLLAYNELSKSVTIEDSGSYETMREKNLSLNSEILHLTEMILARGDTLTNDFHITLDDYDNYIFDTENETTINRFRADVYGYRTVDELKENERFASADQIINDLSAEDRFGLVYSEEPFTDEELQAYGMPRELDKASVLHIINVRYRLSLVSFQRYMPVTVARNVSDETVAAVMENTASMTGVNVADDYIRVYTTGEEMGPVIGYTGQPSQEELEDLQEVDSRYSNTSIIGKAGVEQKMETTLQGTDGWEEVVVDNLGRVLDIRNRVEPQQGRDVWLSIDTELQAACYQILEQRIAGILTQNLVEDRWIDKMSLRDDEMIPISVYDVYNALFSNNVLDISHFGEEDASDTEKKVYSALQAFRAEITAWLEAELNNPSAAAFNDLSIEHQAYMSYIRSSVLTAGSNILDTSKINLSDETYQAFITDGSISMRAFLLHAVNENWVDLTRLPEDTSEYLTAEEIYQAVIDYISEHLPEDEGFDKVLYKYMLQHDRLIPFDVIQLLYDQGILNKEDDLYNDFRTLQITPMEVIHEKMTNLEITPAQLALDPCAGSIVVTDPDTGKVRACVTYPGYDNTRLVNNMDTDYYYELTVDQSSPFYNKATQQLTAPGSTYKPVVAAAGLEEKVIDRSSQVLCTGVFGAGFLDDGDQVHCWYLDGHGDLTVTEALEHSCNVFFCQVGYSLGETEDGRYRQSTELAMLHKYSADFGLEAASGVEIPETDPHISDDLAIPSAIGQGTHQFTTVQLARYANTLASKGICYDLSMIDHIADAEGNVTDTKEPVIHTTSRYTGETWNLIWQGMRSATISDNAWQGFSLNVYTKTGTAQESKIRPDHSLAIGFTEAHNRDHEDIAYAIRIPFGYTSRNASLVAKDMLNYYFEQQPVDTILLGRADESEMYTTVTHD